MKQQHKSAPGLLVRILLVSAVPSVFGHHFTEHEGNVFAVLLGWAEHEAGIVWYDLQDEAQQLVWVSLLHLRGILSNGMVGAQSNILTLNQRSIYRGSYMSCLLRSTVLKLVQKVLFSEPLTLLN